MKTIFKLALIVFMICVPFVGWLFLYMWYSSEKLKKIENGRQEIYERIRRNPNETDVYALMEYCKENKLINQPKYWNEIRGIWFIVNESPNITNELKYSFRDFLMTNGLRITGNDKNVIKNYKKA